MTNHNMNGMYDVIVIGAGPAGAAAAINAARHESKIALVAESFLGESGGVRIENWLGDPGLSKKDLAKKLEEHLKVFDKSLTIKIPTTIVKIEKYKALFKVKTPTEQLQGKALIIATGTSHKRLLVGGENRLYNKGISYCINCDAPFYSGKKVALVSNAGKTEEASKTLSKYAKNVYLIELQEIIRIEGETWVTGVTHFDPKAKQEQLLLVDGIFVELGFEPNSGLVKELVELDDSGFIVTDAQTGATSQPGIFAAGDVANGKYKQYNIAAGDGVKAALAARDYLNSL